MHSRLATKFRLSCDYFKNRESAELKAWMDSHKPGENGTTIGEAVAPKKKASKKKAEKSEEEA